jgi:uncharacterized membrane protein YedE/YeeE
VKRTVAALIAGLAFGFLISWGQFTDPDRIQQMLLLEDPYLYEMMFSAMAVAFVGGRLLTRRHTRALLSGEPITLKTERPRANHFTGAALFGLGWAVTCSCPAPIAGQLAQGALWSVATIAGVLTGVEIYLRGRDVSPDPAPAAASAPSMKGSPRTLVGSADSR